MAKIIEGRNGLFIASSERHGVSGFTIVVMGVTDNSGRGDSVEYATYDEYDDAHKKLTALLSMYPTRRDVIALYQRLSGKR